MRAHYRPKSVNSAEIFRGGAVAAPKPLSVLFLFAVSTNANKPMALVAHRYARRTQGRIIILILSIVLISVFFYEEGYWDWSREAVELPPNEWLFRDDGMFAVNLTKGNNVGRHPIYDLMEMGEQKWLEMRQR